MALFIFIIQRDRTSMCLTHQDGLIFSFIPKHIQLDNHKIEVVESVRLLGVKLGNELEFICENAHNRE